MNNDYYKADIEKITSDSKMTFDEKLKELDKLKQDFYDFIEQTKRNIHINNMYCPQCDTYYRKNSFEYITRKIVPKFSANNYPGCNEIVDAMTMECPGYICPKGHYIIDDWEG